MKWLFTILLAATGLGSGAAQAHGPVRQKVTLEVKLDATPDEVWALIGNFQDMSWLPLVASTTGEGGNVPEATRVLTLKAPG
ncbi:MAG: SRPBCC family protein, partial [Paracoccaceae bacterium]